MFILKKIITCFLFPLPLGILISFVGLYMLWFTARLKTGRILVSTGLIILTLFSYNAVAKKLLKPLEGKYRAFEIEGSASTHETDTGSDIKFIVVLGGGHTTDPEMPITSQIGSSSLVRLIDGIRIYRKHPDANLILSGGIVFDPIPEAETMARVAKAIGVPEGDIILESRSKDPKDQARLIKPIVGNKKFVLVTSASHMPRSMALFRKLGMNPIPSPTDHRVMNAQGLGPGSFFPSPGNLEKSQAAIHEYLGMTWARIKGQM